MKKKLVFDTLAYAKLLENGGVEHADVHAASLAESIIQNIYIKSEVDNMVEAALKRFDERTREIGKQTGEVKAELKEDVRRLETEMHRLFTRHTWTTIGVISALMALFAFTGHFFG